MAFFAYLLLCEYFLQLLGRQWLVWLVAPPPVFVVNPRSDGNKAEIRASRTRLFLQGAHSHLRERGYARRTLGVWRSRTHPRACGSFSKLARGLNHVLQPQTFNAFLCERYFEPDRGDLQEVCSDGEQRVPGVSSVQTDSGVSGEPAAAQHEP